MSDIVIKAENIGKRYRLGEINTGTLSHDLNRWWARIRGKEDPFSRVMEKKDSVLPRRDHWIPALKDINFEVRQGQVLGIIGRNGAGKSTLLKILSKITTPTSGIIKIRGRVAALLEVGTGFHQELTGKENVYLNGAILGMNKPEIKRKFDEIVDFSGVERYIDTPVKRYSSGMSVRLAFAVAAHLEPEILVVDEVLAVGDWEFQKKCLGKMKDVSVKEGRTVLFVSHNMTAVKSLCSSGIVLENGSIAFNGNSVDAVNFYQKEQRFDTKILHEGEYSAAPGNENIRILKFEVGPARGETVSVSSGINFILEFYNANEKKNIAVTFELTNADDTVIFHHGLWVCGDNTAKKGVFTIRGTIHPNLLNSGSYKFSLIFAESLYSVLFQTRDIIQFDVSNEIFDGNTRVLPGVIRPDIPYEVSYKPVLQD